MEAEKKTNPAKAVTFFHENYIRDNNVDESKLPGEIQEKIKSFSALKEKIPGLPKKMQGPQKNELNKISEDILEDIESFFDEQEELEAAEKMKGNPGNSNDPVPPAKAVDEKKKGGWGWALFGMLVVLAAGFGISLNANTNTKK